MVSLCWLLGHRYNVELTFNGKNPGDVRIISCDKCSKKWVMSDYHRALIRYDNDPEFVAGLRELYPFVRNW